MSPIINGQWEAPFWGTSKTFITGQDMLGMQNTSIATYAILLPGLTNLTRRIRYYGFYVWMLEQYAKRKGRVSVKEFQQFMRRGELLLAFVMSYKYPEEQGIVGSQYAKNYLSEKTDNVDIAGGADRDSGERTYWKYSFGAFGQYYQGALKALGLIATSANDKRIHVSTPNSGRRLAEYFEKTIPEETRNLFLDTIDKGTIKSEELELFSKKFSLTGIQQNTEEWKFYVEILLGSDYPIIEVPNGHAIFRRETIILYLEYLNNLKKYVSSGSFPRSFYYRLWGKKPFTDFESSQGWYYYALNEFAHYSLETIFWALLVELNNLGPTPIHEIVNDFCDKTISAINIGEHSLDITDDMDFYSFSKHHFDREFSPGLLTEEISQTREHEKFNAVKNALIVLAMIYYHDKEHITKIHSYSRKNGMYRSGDVMELLEWINKHREISFKEFIKKLLVQKVINRHIEVAMRKMRNRNENTLKFILEDNFLKPVAIVEPVWTGPRINSLHQFLVDLKLVNDNSELTKFGAEILKEKMQ